MKIAFELTDFVYDPVKIQDARDNMDRLTFLNFTSRLQSMYINAVLKEANTMGVEEGLEFLNTQLTKLYAVMLLLDKEAAFTLKLP